MQKQTLENRIVQIKLCKENHQVQSKTFSMEFRFETKLGCFVTRYRTFAHCYSSTHFLNLQWHQIYCGKVPRFTYSALFSSWYSWTLIIFMKKNLQIQSNLCSWFSFFQSNYRDSFEIIIFITLSIYFYFYKSLSQFFKVSTKS